MRDRQEDVLSKKIFLILFFEVDHLKSSNKPAEPDHSDLW